MAAFERRSATFKSAVRKKLEGVSHLLSDEALASVHSADDLHKQDAAARRAAMENFYEDAAAEHMMANSALSSVFSGAVSGIAGARGADGIRENALSQTAAIFRQEQAALSRQASGSRATAAESRARITAAVDSVENLISKCESIADGDGAPAWLQGFRDQLENISSTLPFADKSKQK